MKSPKWPTRCGSSSSNMIEFEPAAQRAGRGGDSASLSSARRKWARLPTNSKSTVGRIVQTMSSSATELEVSATTSDENRGNDRTAVRRRRKPFRTKLPRKVRSAAAATEEMSASIAEISRQVEESNRIAGEAVAQARDHRRAHQRAVEGGGADRRRGQPDRDDRRADQSAGAQRHHRGGAGRRIRTRLRRGRAGGEGARLADREGNQRHQ